MGVRGDVEAAAAKVREISLEFREVEERWPVEPYQVRSIYVLLYMLLSTFYPKRFIFFALGGGERTCSGSGCEECPRYRCHTGVTSATGAPRCRARKSSPLKTLERGHAESSFFIEPTRDYSFACLPVQAFPLFGTNDVPMFFRTKPARS